jgi:hypothetical protein
MSRAARLADALLQDRKRRQDNKPKSTRQGIGVERFDPFASLHPRVAAGADPGYLPRTLMRMGPVGWFNCRHCLRKFESKGWGYCPRCMELPAEERRSEQPVSDRLCRGCSNPIPKRRRADAKYCSETCAKSAENRRGYQGSGHPKFRGDRGEIPQLNQWSIFELKTWPLNLIGGFRRPDDIAVHPDTVAAILRCEVGLK